MPLMFAQQDAALRASQQDTADIEALRTLLKALEKPLRAIFVTRSHPDHFNGVHALMVRRPLDDGMSASWLLCSIQFAVSMLGCQLSSARPCGFGGLVA
jgi:ribonuclease BN (tRNA processing enzyme)